MKTPAKLGTTSTLPVLQTLSWVRKQGFRPVPLHPKSKAAINRDYVSLNYKPPSDDFWKNGDYGVGVVTGPAHSGPVDVDLDCQEAIYFASVFFPTTSAVFGRASKRRSHFLFRVDSMGFEKVAFLDPLDNSTIIELRGDAGHQTVLPGSIHEGTGELIEWDAVAFPEVGVVPADVLTLAARKTALATLIVRHIWAPGYHNEPTKHLAGMFFYLDWPEDEAVSVIQAVMDYTDDKDKSRVPTIRATYRRAEKGAKVSGAGVLRKQLKNDPLVDRLLELAGSPTINLLQEYNDRFAVVNMSGKFRIADLDVPPSEPPIFWHKDDFSSMYGTELSDLTNDKGQRISKPKVWLANPRRRTYKTVDFLPGQEDTDCLNLWTGWATEPKDGDCNGFLELLEDVVCGGDTELATWLMNWFCNIIREPMNKPLTAPVIVGVEGAGKSLLFSYFGEILGRAYVSVTKDDHIHGRFNAHLGNVLLLHSEEALYAGDKKHAGIVRSLITDRYNMLELKGVDARQVKSYLRLAITSNDLYSAPVKPGDRRYNVFDMGERKLDAALQAKVLEELRTDGPAALHWFLVNEWDYDGAQPRTNIKNDALLAIKGINLPPIEAWWLHTLQTAQLLPDYLAWASQPDPDGGKADWPEVVSSAALYKAMTHHAKATGARGVPNETLFSYNMNRFVGLQLRRSQRNFINPIMDEWPQDVKLMSARQYTIMNMPVLDDCRISFERHLGQKIEWSKIEKQVKSKQDRHDKF